MLTKHKPHIIFENSVSENGLFHDFRMVGIKPSISIVEARITDRIGCFAINHKNKATKARIKNTVSDLVISLVPYRKPSANIKKQITATANVTHDPTPAPLVTCNPYAIAVTSPQINHV